MPKPPPVYNAQFVLRPEHDLSYVPFEHAAEHPFAANAASVPRVNAWWLAEAALASYWDPAPALARFQAAGFEAEFVEEGGTECYVAWQTDWLLVAFRGTEGDRWEDILTDAKFAQVPWRIGHVHAGFADAVRAIEPELTGLLGRVAPGRTVWFCGHSLGAALATLAADRYDRAHAVCTFGSPRVGDRAFASAFNERFADRSLRYVNHHDIVTHVPPPVLPPWQFRHVASRRFIDSLGRVSTAAPALAHFFPDLIGHPRTLLEMVTGIESGVLAHPPAFFLDHMPKAYAIWAWNDYEAHGSEILPA